MKYLLDVNVMIALAWPTHIHHSAAQKWFGNCGISGWASCPLTQTAFVRISSNPKFIDGAVPPKLALSMLAQACRHPSHSFWRDDLDIAAGSSWPSSHLMGHRQVTDAYLLGLAIRNKGKLATLDANLGALLPQKKDREAFIEVIPA